MSKKSADNAFAYADEELRQKIVEDQQADIISSRLAAIVTFSDDAIISKDLNGIITSWNKGAEKIFGYTADEIIGISIMRLMPADRQDEEEHIFRQTIQGKSIEHFETLRQTKDGRLINVSLTVSPIRDVMGKIIGASKIARDITVQKAYERELRRITGLYAALSEVNQGIVKTCSREELFTKICKVLVEFGGFRMVWIGLLDAATQQVFPASRCGEMVNYLDEVAIYADKRLEGQGPVGTAIREGRTYICNDFAHDPSTMPWREAAARASFRAGAVLPIRQESVVCGAIIVYSDEIGFFQDKEITLLEEVASDVSFALDNLLREEERRNAEAIAQNEKFFSDTMIESMPGILYFYTDEGQFLRWNRNFETISGYSGVEISRMHPLDFFSDEEKSSVKQRIGTVFEQGNSSIEASFVAKDGKATPYFFTGRKVVFNGAQCLVGMGIDITDRKRAEEALRNSLAQTKRFIEQAPISIAMFDRSMNYLAVSDRWLSEYGRGYSSLIGHNHYEVQPDMPAEWKSIHQQGLAGATLKNNADIWVDADGRERWLRWAVVPWSDDTGAIGGIIISTEDITEGKLAEQAVQQSEQELRIAATAFEAQEGIMITDANNVILRVNQSFTKITSYSAEEVIGQTPALLSSGKHDAEFYRRMWESITSEHYWHGEIWNRRKNGEVYPEWLTISAVTSLEGKITHYVGSFFDISQYKAAENKIEHLAFYDPLTGLPNRRLLQDRLEHAFAVSARHLNYGALFFIDLDNFKMLNNTRGHNIGDLLLEEVAKRLQACVRELDTVARLGGDEFVVLVENLSKNVTQAAAMSEAVGGKILDALSQAYMLENYEYYCSASIGISLFRKREVTAHELLKRADTAMYQAKAAGRNALRFYDPAMQEALEARTALECDLRCALAENQFRLYYQMQVYHNGKVIAAEVLLRWQHPKYGLISPVNFIPLAEETGLIVPIGQWVLETACAQLKAWEKYINTQHLKLAINVSSRQFRQSDFVEQVREAVLKSQIDPDRLDFELTESLVLDDIEDTIVKMQALKAFGVRFSMDDFGTGYSSLSYLTQLPFNQLKIDQSFVRNLGVKESDAVIVQTIIGMANSLGMEVIAEGVETEAQLEFLKQQGCPVFQGYLFGQPVPLAEFEERLKSAVNRA